ncbi:MAG: hypothetical protein ACOC4J_04215 [Bacteroidota bacterium]
MKKVIAIFGAFLVSATMSFAQNNEASSKQQGNNNDSEIEQTGIENHAGVTNQKGNNNEAFIQQGDFGGNFVQSNYAEASIRQVGDRNDADIQQRQGFDEGSAVSIHTVEQIGNDNTGVFTTFNGGNTGMIYQDGNDNFAKGKQASNPDLDIQITQLGNANIADVDQRRSYSDVLIRQDGNQNNTTVEQDGTGNFFDEDTKGSLNVVSAEQIGENSDAFVDIIGNSNTIGIYQTSDGNTATSFTQGNGNTVSITQTNGDHTP